MIPSKVIPHHSDTAHSVVVTPGLIAGSYCANSIMNKRSYMIFLSLIIIIILELV